MFITVNFQKAMILITLGSVLFKILTGNPVFIFIALLCSSLSFVLTYIYKCKLSYCFLYFFFLIYVLFLGLYHVDSDDKNYILYMVYITLAIQLSLTIRQIDFDYQAAKYLLVIALSWTIYHILQIGYNPDAYNNLLDGSRNYISAHLIIFLAYYIFACRKRMIDVNLFYPTIVVVCCFFLFGRSGIALSFFLFFITVLQKNKIIKVMVVLPLISGFYFYQLELISLFTSSNFSHGVETERSIMFSEYISSLSNWRNFLFGVDFKYCCETIMAFKANPHNSFINLHSRFGILPFALGIYVYIYIFAKRLFIKSLMVNVLVLVILARYFVDSIGFFGIIDFILVSMFIYILFDDVKNVHKGSLSYVSS